MARVGTKGWIHLMYVMYFKECQGEREREEERSQKSFAEMSTGSAHRGKTMEEEENERRGEQRGDEISRLLLQRDKTMSGWMIINLHEYK